MIINKVDVVLGKQLRSIRLRRDMTLQEVAKKLGISYQQIQKYEAATSKVAASLLFKMADLYSVPVNLFFNNVKTYCRAGQINPDPKNRKFKILMVEDNPGDEAIIRKALEGINDIDVLCVHDFQQVMNVTKYGTSCPEFARPNMFFLDLYIPKCNGISILKDLRKNSNLNGVPIVILTNSVNRELMDESYRLGASGYICKSFDFDLFKKNIENCVYYWSKSVVLPEMQKV